jgi:hypothetical protein
VLEEIRILSNLETNEQKLLQIVLVGQLNLLDVLHKAELRQLDQRISIRCSLKALSREEVEAYVTHRLWVARGSTAVAFSPHAFDLVHAISGGVPRMINLVCDRALMEGCELKTNRITEDHVARAAAQLGLDVPKGKIKGERPAGGGPIWRRPAVMAAAVLLVVLGGAVAMFGNPIDVLRSEPPPAAPRVTERWLPLRVAPMAVPGGMPVMEAPSPMPGSFSVLVGTYDSARQVTAIEHTLRAQKLPVYFVDVLVAPDDMRRRVLVGRYATREEAEAVRAQLGPTLITARVIPGAQERLRAVP